MLRALLTVVWHKSVGQIFLQKLGLDRIGIVIPPFMEISRSAGQDVTFPIGIFTAECDREVMLSSTASSSYLC